MSDGIKKTTFKVTVLPIEYKKQVPRRERPTGTAEYMAARTEKLRELYSEMEPEYHRICTYEDPVDGRRNKHELWEVEEGESPFDLPDFEDRMPNPEDYIK